MNTRSLKVALGTLALALAFGGKAIAVPITGSLDLAGGAVLDSTSLASATQVNSWGAVTVASPFGVTIGSVLDSTINPGDSVTMASGSWAFTSGKPMLWSVGGFTFDLNSSWVVTQTSTFLNIEGTGTISGNGYDPTSATWAFTSQATSSHPLGSFSFSATTAATPSVPDGGTTALLLGLGLTGVAMVARKRQLV